MCGLVGVLALGERAGPVEAPVLARMTEMIAHRGPDGDGVWLSPDARIGLGHRRLSIIDLDARASQPMHDTTGQLVVVFNGEIYNHRDLRTELEAKGARFATDHSDTEVLLEGYRAWGIDGLLERLSGMFAFALYDRARDTLLLARDRTGIKPLYFAEHEGRLAFASEIKALLAMPGLPRRLDRAAFGHYLTFLVAPAPATLFSGIAKLPAAHLMVVGPDRRPKVRRWWDPAAVAHRAATRPCRSNLTRAEIVADVRHLLEASVARHMVADVPVGVFLSGGVDSGAVLALATRVAGRPLRTFTVGFTDDTALNELDEARAAARLADALHHEVLIGEREAADSLEAIVRHQDEPLADWVCVPLWHVAGLAHATGTKAILVGEGADEMFLGYASYQRFLGHRQRMERLRRFMPPGAGALVDAAGRLVPAERLGLLGLMDHAARGLDGREVFWSGAVAWWEMQKRQVWPGMDERRIGWPAYGLRGAGLDDRSSDGIVRDLLAGTGDLPPETRLRIAELALRLPELLLMRIDKMSMAHSLEARVPFLDPALVDYALSLDGSQLLAGGRLKSVLKEALAGIVPADVLDRPKRGFGAPMGRWLSGELGRRLESRVLDSRLIADAGLNRNTIARLFAAHRSGRRDLSLHLWPLINAALWHDHWIEGGA